MSDIIGIIPGAGRASRIGGFFKELTPINVNPADQSKFIVVSERIIGLIRNAGATPIYFVVNSDNLAFAHFNNACVFLSLLKERE